MKDIRLLQIVAASLLACLPIGFFARYGLAQRNDADLTAALLTGAECVVSGSSNYYSELNTDTASVAISYQVFKRLFSLRSINEGGDSTLSCRASNQEFSTVDLRIGVTDGNAEYGTSMTINVYQGGNLKHTYRAVQAGTMISVLIDLSDPRSNNPESFAIQIFDCNGSRHCYLQFIEATLHPAGPVTSFSSNGVIPQMPATIPNATPVQPGPIQPGPILSEPSPPSPPTPYDDNHPKPPWLQEG